MYACISDSGNRTSNIDRKIPYLCNLKDIIQATKMEKKRIICGLLSFACVAPLSAQSNKQEREQKATPSRAASLQEVVVTGTRKPADTRHLTQTVSIIHRLEIERSHTPSLLPLISEQVPGLFITARGVMGYGVSGGAAGGINLRGISGGAGRLMVLIDGHPQYMGLMGHPIADSYQSFLAEQVEVLHGPASVLYGSNAMGGVINIVTRRMPTDGVQTEGNVGYGSWNTLQSDVLSRIGHGRFTGMAGISYNRTDGHRADMGFEQFSGYAKTNYKLTAHWNITAGVNATRFMASQPGTVTTPLRDADQRITRGMASAAIENHYARTSGALSIFHNWGDHWINDGYTTDPADNNVPKAYRFNSNDFMTGVSWYQCATLFKGNQLTVGMDYYHFGGKAWNQYVEGERAGQRDDLADKAKDEWASYAMFQQDIGTRLTLEAGIRADHHTDMGTEWIPQAGLSLHLPAGTEVKASSAKGFRYPTIREMYMFPPRNPNLKPESLWNHEIAFAQKLSEGKVSYGINLFYIKGKNMIVAVPREGATPLNMNTGQVKNAGIELQASWLISPQWSAETDYSFLHMHNPVPAAPEHKLHAGVTYVCGKLSLSTDLQNIRGLYTAMDTPDGDIKENFVLWNINATYRLSPHWKVWVRGENLLAQRYEINAGYPMPRATAFGGVSVNF